jgi:hypothetical protein
MWEQKGLKEQLCRFSRITSTHCNNIKNKVCVCVCVCVCVYIYIYIYRERERERERQIYIHYMLCIIVLTQRGWRTLRLHIAVLHTAKIHPAQESLGTDKQCYIKLITLILLLNLHDPVFMYFLILTKSAYCISQVCPFVCLSACIISAPTGRMFVIFDIGDLQFAIWLTSVKNIGYFTWTPKYDLLLLGIWKW